MNVAAVTLDTINAMYRVRVPLLAMQALGHGTYEERGRSIRRPDILMRSDVVLFYRHWDAHARKVARQLSDTGIVVVFDNDVAAIPRDVAGYRTSGGGHAIMNEIWGWSEGHLMTTTTERARRAVPLPLRDGGPVDRQLRAAGSDGRAGIATWQ